MEIDRPTLLIVVVALSKICYPRWWFFSRGQDIV